MSMQSLAALNVDRGERSLLASCMALAATATLLAAPICADAAGPSASSSAPKSDAVRLEAIPGSPAKRVTLTQKAAERLGIETGKIGEEPVVRRQMVSGLVVPPLKELPKPQPAGGSFGSLGQRAAAGATQTVANRVAAEGDTWILVTLSDGEWDRLAKDKPARVMPLTTREATGKEVAAVPAGIPPIEDSRRSMLRLYYVVPGQDHGLAVNSRMRVELELAGNGEVRKVAPYGAVLYDATGAAWVYVNAKPLVYERQRIEIDRVIGDRAIVTDGPPVGTTVVTVGAAMLFGAEIFGK